MKKYVIASLLMTSAAPAFSQADFYGEFLLGSADQTLSGSSSGVTVDLISDSDIAMGLRGGYQFNETFAAELTIQNFGEAEGNVVDDNLRLETSAVAIGIKAALPISDQFLIVGRLGISSWDSELSSSNEGTGTDDGSDVYYGLGLEYGFSDTMYFGAEYTITAIDLGSEDGISVDNDVEVLNFYLGYKF